MPIKVLPGARKSKSAVTLSELLANEGKTDATKKETVPGKAPEDLTFINEGFPPIAAKIVKKIERGEYIDLIDLLPSKPGMEEPSYAELAKEGIIVVTETRHLKGQKKAIQDIATWMEAFLLFATIRNRSHPDHTNDLLAYGALIVKGAKDYKGPGWLAYDYQFRRLAAARGNLGNWGQRDVSLWNDTVCKPYTYEVQKPLPQSNEATTGDSKGVKRKVTTPSSGYKKPRTPGREKQ